MHSSEGVKLALFHPVPYVAGKVSDWCPGAPDITMTKKRREVMGVQLRYTVKHAPHPFTDGCHAVSGEIKLYCGELFDEIVAALPEGTPISAGVTVTAVSYRGAAVATLVAATTARHNAAAAEAGGAAAADAGGADHDEGEDVVPNPNRHKRRGA